MRPWFIVQIPSDFTILIHASARDATIDDGKRIANLFILIHASARDATIDDGKRIANLFILIHASARDATAKSYKIGNNFTVLVRKFVQIFDILILHISIFLEKQEQYFYFCSANLPGFLRCFRFAPTFSYIVCQNLRLVDFSVEVF